MTATGLRLQVIARRLGATVMKRFGRPPFHDLPAPEVMGEVETIPCRPALFEDDHLPRIRACGFGQTIPDELEKLRATSFPGYPAERFRLGESILAGGVILTKRHRHILRRSSDLKALRSELVSLDEATLLNSQQGLHYFGHWLQDDAPLYETLRDAPSPISLRRPDWPDRHVYEKAFDQTWREVDFAHVRDLTLWRDLSYTRDKARRMAGLRAKLREALPAKGAGRVVYVSRGRMGEPRNMSNVEEFEDALRKAGVAVIQPGTGGADLLAELSGADGMIAIEGSQACHGLYTLADGGAFLILQPPDRFYNPLRNWAAVLGMRYGIVVGEADDTSFRVDPDEVLRMVDRVRAEPAQDAWV